MNRPPLPALALVLVFLPVGAAAQASNPALPEPRLVLEAVHGPRLELLASWGLPRDLGPEPVLGQVIPIGSTLKTGEATVAVLRLEPAGTRLILGEGTALSPRVLEDPSYPRSEFELLAGRLRVIVAPGRICRIKTPEAEALAPDFRPLPLGPQASALLRMSTPPD